MATASETIYTHTCDLCGTEHARKDLHRLGLTYISEGGPGSLGKPTIESGKTCDVCPDCESRPASEILAFLKQAAEQAANHRVYQVKRTA